MQFSLEEINPRKAWIDVLKGIAIMFVVLGHNPITTSHPKVFNVIFSFHMPLFYFISGYLFNPDSGGVDLFKKRFNSLIRPYFFTVICISLCYILVKRSPSPVWYFFWALYGNGPNLPKIALQLWFLPSLYITILFVWFTFKYVQAFKKYKISQILFICGLLVCGYFSMRIFWDLKIPLNISDFFITDGHRYLINGLLDNPAYSKEQLLKDNQFVLKGLPWNLDISCVTVAFFISGYFVRRHNLEYVFHKPSIGLLMVALFATLHYLYNCTIDLNLRRYDNIIISTLLAFTGIYICTFTSKLIAFKNNHTTTLIQYIGRYSLIIFIFHPILQRNVWFGILAFYPAATYITYLPVFVAGVGLPLLLNWILLERFKAFRFWYYAK
jgi:polysaccharide biosynthesis protein PslL